MITDVFYAKKGVVYRIKNRKTSHYLTSGTQVVTSPLTKGKIAQLWLFDQIKSNAYQIVSLQSGHVLSRKQNLTIQKGNWSACQFWKLQRAQIDKNINYFWIVANDDQSMYMFGSSATNKVAMKNYDNTLFVSNWQIQQIDIHQDLAGCCIFKSQFSNMVIDVPQGSNKQGINIIQYHYNGRGNQRWVLQRVVDSFVIRNLCSNMILVPNNKILKAGTKIIQGQFTNKTQQKWIIQKQGNHKFLIKTRGDITLYLGVASAKQSAYIQLVSEKEKGTWILQGSIPIIQDD